MPRNITTSRDRPSTRRNKEHSATTRQLGSTTSNSLEARPEDILGTRIQTEEPPTLIPERITYI